MFPTFLCFMYYFFVEKLALLPECSASSLYETKTIECNYCGDVYDNLPDKIEDCRPHIFNIMTKFLIIYNDRLLSRYNARWSMIIQYVITCIRSFKESLAIRKLKSITLITELKLLKN